MEMKEKFIGMFGEVERINFDYAPIRACVEKFVSRHWIFFFALRNRRVMKFPYWKTTSIPLGISVETK